MSAAFVPRPLADANLAKFEAQFLSKGKFVNGTDALSIAD